jgi:beta-lactam-binding protein with PASTA domain
MRSFLRLVLLALVLVVVALVSALTAMRFAIHGREVWLPNMVGKTPTEARRIAQENGLQLDIERQYYSATISEGRILSQMPPAGTKVRRGWDIRVAESLGPQRVDIPNVVGESQRAAEINIRRRGLDIGSVASITIPNGTPDQIVAQNPAPAASGVASPKISLLVNSTPPAQAFVMPNFVGQTLASVTQAVRDAGLHVGQVTIAAQAPTAAPDSTIPATIPNPQPMPTSIVSSQNPAAGQKVTAGATVSLEVR